MAPGSYAQQNPCKNLLASFTTEQDELAGSQDSIRKSNAGSNKALTLSEALTPVFVSPTKNLFTKFIKAIMESI